MNSSEDRQSRNKKGDSVSKKRKRNEKRDRGVAQKDDEDVPSVSRSPTRRKVSSSSLLLKGSLFAVSTLVDASSEEFPEAYSQIISLCKDLGAQTTGQVHKRVNAVIATESAVTGNTQRVRKAWKKGIPVISPDWIHACIKKGRSVDIGPYTHSQKKEDDSRRTESKKGAKVSTKSDKVDSEKATERHVDLGCCCVCHESAVDGRTNCSWCVDCSVNRQHDDEKEKEVTIDLGCCCVCHEAEKGRTDCDWCFECSVNKQFVE
eukprot:scaffold4239_cov156-Amphora_coffeaeformis.AAC.2